MRSTLATPIAARFPAMVSNPKGFFVNLFVYLGKLHQVITFGDSLHPSKSFSGNFHHFEPCYKWLKFIGHTDHSQKSRSLSFIWSVTKSQVASQIAVHHLPGEEFHLAKNLMILMIFHHLLQEKMRIWKQVRFRNLLFSHGSQALFSTIFQENQQRFLFVTVFRWCDDSRNPPWLEWQHFFYIRLQKYNSKIGWQTGGFPISSRRIWWLQCAETLLITLWTNELKCGLLSFCWVSFELNMTI